MTSCSMVAKRMGNDLITGKQKIGDISNSMKTATASTKALGVAMNVFANVGFMLAITAISKVVSELAQAQENAVQAAKEATEAYNDEISSIDDYKTRLSELHEELNSGNLSYEETKTKRTELMSIQDELIEKFGTEKGAIESATEAINGQVDALDTLNEKSYRDWVAKADKQTFWNQLLPGGKSGLDQAIDYMETDQTISIMDMENANLSEDLQKIQAEIDKTIQSKYNLEKQFATFKVTGTPEEIKSQLEAIRQDYLDLSEDAFLENGISSEMWEEYRKEAIDSLNEVINKFDDGLKKHQETYQTYIEGMIKYDSEYSDEYATILQKRAELESAQNSGNEEEIQKARQAFMDAINKGIEESGSNENIRKYFESLYPELQSEFSSWNFEIALDANTGGLANIANEIGEKYTATDLLGMLDDDSAIIADSAFNSLIDKAIEYGICTDKSAEEVQKLIDLLVELGIVQDNVKTDTFNNEIASFQQVAEDIQSLTKGFDQLDSIYADMIDGEDFDYSAFLNSEEFAETFGALTNVTEEYKDAYDEFIETVSNSNGKLTSESQNAFNKLATAYIEHQGILEDVTESTKATAISQLEQMGVSNAEEVVIDALAQKERNLAVEKEKVALASQNLAMNSWNQINALLNEEGASEVAKIAMAQLALEKLHVNGITISTSKDIEQIINLANTALVGAESLAQLTRAKAVLSAVEKSGGDLETAGVAMWEYTDALNTIEDLKNGTYEFKTETLDLSKVLVDYSGGAKTATVANKNLKDATDAANEALKKQKEQLEKNKEALEDQRTEMEALHSAIIDYIDDEIENIDDKTSSIEKQNEKLQDQLDIYDDIISAVTNNIDIEIDSIDDEIKKLQDANDEKEKALALEEAQRKNREANSRKTKLIFQEGVGFIYQTDTKAIKESETELANLQEEALIDSLEKEKELLEENKQKWLDIADAREKALQAGLAKDYFGDDWRQTTLNPSDEMLGKLQGDYVGTQIQIEQNNSIIEELNKEKEFWENQKELWQDALDEYENQQNRARLASFFGSDYEYQLLNNSATWRKKFASEYADVCRQIEEVENQIKALNEETTSSITSNAEKASGALGGVSGALEETRGKAEETGNLSKYIWDDATDGATLRAAQAEFDQLTYWIEQGKTGFEGARDALATFIAEYPKLNGATEASDALKNSVSDLQSIYENTGRSFGTLIDGADGRITDFEVKSRTLKDNLTEVDNEIQSIANSEATIEEKANGELSNVEQTISNLLTKLDDLKLALENIKLGRTEVETIADEELLDTSTVVDGVHTKVGEIQSAITTLTEAITPLQGALDGLIKKLNTLDEVTLSNVIGEFGGASGGSEEGSGEGSGGKSSSKGQGSESGEGKTGGGTGLLGAIKAVDEAIGEAGEEGSGTGLLGKLAQVDASTLENIIAQFGIGSEDGGTDGGNSLLSSVNAVSNAIVGAGGKDDTSLIASIQRLGSNATIENIDKVTTSFGELLSKIELCVSEVESLADKIANLPSVPNIGGGSGGGSIEGNAKGGIITKKSAGDFDYIAKAIGEDHTIAVQEGEAVIPKENVAKNPELVQSLIDGDFESTKPLEYTRPQFVWENDKRWLSMQLAKQLGAFDYLEHNTDIYPKTVTSKNNVPNSTVNNNNQKSTTVSIGDIHLHEVQNTSDFAKAMKSRINGIVTQELGRK